jgi:hypoxanthine-guanine phosphoribosyltransferase
MNPEREKYIYSLEEYNADIKSLQLELSNIENLHLVSVYRGSIPLVVHLSNLLNCEMSIIKFNEANGVAVAPVFLTNNIKDNDRLVVIEDIYDSGRTIKLVQQLIKWDYKNHTVNYYSLFGRKNEVGVKYLRESNGKWIVFPWETVS